MKTPSGEHRQSQSSGDKCSTPPKRKCKPHACLNCRKSHVDCGGNLPGTLACNRCTKKGLTCGYGKDERTNTTKKEELLRRVETFQGVVDAYFNAIYCMLLSTNPNYKSIVPAAKVAQEQFEVITPKLLSKMLKQEGCEWSDMSSPGYPNFCISALAMAHDGVKLNDTRKAIASFKRDAQDYLESMHLVYGIAAGQLPSQTGGSKHILEVLAGQRGFNSTDFEHLEAQGYNAKSFITADAKANIEKELNDRPRASSSVAAALRSPALTDTRKYSDLIGAGSSTETLVSSSLNTAMTYGSDQGLKSAATYTATQPAPAPHAFTSQNTRMGHDLAGLGSWAEPLVAATSHPGPPPTIGTPFTGYAMQDLQHHTMGIMPEQPQFFDWAMPPSSDEQLLDDNASQVDNVLTQWTYSSVP